MAKTDRGNLRDELNQLWKSTVDQLDEIKDVLVQGGQAGKARIDVSLLRREREKALIALGELAAEHAETNNVPDTWSTPLAEIKRLDGDIERESAQWETLSERVQNAARDVSDAVSQAGHVKDNAPKPSDSNAEKSPERDDAE